MTPSRSAARAMTSRTARWSDSPRAPCQSISKLTAWSLGAKRIDDRVDHTVRYVVTVVVVLLLRLGNGRATPGGTHRLVAHVAHGPDQRLVVRTELRPQPSDVDVDGPGATEEVIAPHLLQQLCAGEHPASVLSQVLQQLEFLVGEVKGPPAQPRGVCALVDQQLAEIDLAEALLIGCASAPAHH